MAETKTYLEKRVENLERDLKALEDHVTHIAATVVAIVERARANSEEEAAKRRREAGLAG